MKRKKKNNIYVEGSEEMKSRKNDIYVEGSGEMKR